VAVAQIQEGTREAPEPEPVAEPESVPAPVEEKSQVNEEEVLSKLVSGNKLGDDLK
jgi:hypothetical protein